MNTKVNLFLLLTKKIMNFAPSFAHLNTFNKKITREEL